MEIIVIGLLIVGFVFVLLKMMQNNKKLQEENTNLKVNQATLETSIKNAENNLSEKVKKLEDEKAKLLDTYKDSFKQLSTEILEAQKKSFSETNKAEISNIVNSLQEKLQDFHNKIDIYRTEESASKENLNNKIESVDKSYNKMVDLTNNFIMSLRSDSHLRGEWGESSVRSILESCGLQKNISYFEQTSENDKRLDFIVRTPTNKFIVIDSKTIFKHYQDYVMAENDEDKKEFLKKHIADIKKTITELGTKKYQENLKKICKNLDMPEDSILVDYVLMCVSPDSALESALKNDKDNGIINEAKRHKIILTTTASLIGLLEVINALWIANNAEVEKEKIQSAADSLAKDFSRFLGNWVVIGNKLKDIANAYEETKQVMGDKETGVIGSATFIAKNLPSTISKKDKENICSTKTYTYDGTGK